MPERSGIDLIADAHRCSERLRIVLVSGHLDAARTEGTIPDSVALLAKPFTRASMAEAIASAMTSAEAAG